MIQGTMSGAGKSILTAGILRVLRQDGYRAAPFKSQNMALNSFVTADGLEMGRAQVVQAAAAGLPPSADMNPILLKPMGDTTSQVIVNGKPIGKMRAADYYRVKKSLVPDILAAYNRLREKADVIVIEGAGSPVEINLREGDFVNMGLAEMVDAPVLLVGNIDPGGVFAQLLGTVQLMRPEERARVKGLIINKFRGDVGLLEPGLSMFREYCDIPFAGVVPWVKLSLDEEDSMSERLSGKGNAAPVGSASARSAAAGISDPEGTVDIAVIRLPYLSNYTDFAPLEDSPGVSVRYVPEVSSLGNPDLIILPGTKNTLGDLRWLRESGLADRIDALVGSPGQSDRSDGPAGSPSHSALLMGICGGYQMLGRRIRDPLGSEAGGSAEGLGYLPVETVFGSEKYTRQRGGKTLRLPGIWAPLSLLPVSGYEIHMGETEYLWGETGEAGAFSDLGATDDMGESGGSGVTRATDGAVRGNVLGTYLHGLFDEPALRGALLKMLRDRKRAGAPEAGAAEDFGPGEGHESALKWQDGELESALKRQDRELDRLAEVLRRSLDWELIYRAIGEKR